MRVFSAALFLLLSGVVMPSELDGMGVARAVDRVNRFAAVDNVSYGTADSPVVVLDRSAGGRTVVNTFERWRNNAVSDANVLARDLVIFRSGKLRGTGILVSDFADPGRGRQYVTWLPSLRKLRRLAEPDAADRWGNSNFSYGDIYVRRPEDERHELLGEETFDDCLGVVQLPAEQRDRHTRHLPAADCSVRGRRVYRLLSRPLRGDLGYDERHTLVDVVSFADVRSTYYAAGRVVKVIDKSWRGMGADDPLAQYWVYWYARSEDSGQEGMAFVDPGAVRWDSDLDPELWSEGTLRRIRR